MPNDYFISKEIELKTMNLAHFKSSIELSNDTRTFSFVNPYSYSVLRERLSLVKKIDCFYVDGGLLCSLRKYKLGEATDRVSFDFSSIAGFVFNHSIDNNLKVAVIGGSEEENKKMLDYLHVNYNGINLAYSSHGYIKKNEWLSIVNRLNELNINILICGMGTPLQEEFISYAMEKTKVNKLYTCGGFITQTASKGDYYHPLIKKLNLRWLQRFFDEKHVRQRVLFLYPRFLLHYLCSKVPKGFL